MKRIFAAIVFTACTGIAAAGPQFDHDYFFRSDSNIKPAWMPEVVKSDGQKTYIEFPKDLLAPPKPGESNKAPSLVPIGSDVVRYRVIGDRFEVDSVIEKAMLVGPTGSNDRVWIYHKSALPKDAN